MASVKIKTIDFATKQVGSEDISLATDSALSAKNVAFVISWQLSKRRAGTAKIKTMAEISGTTAKPHKQKGTGHARQGSKRSVQFRGGRTCHGPLPRSFEYSLPKKIVSKALVEVLQEKLKEQEVFLYTSDSTKFTKTSQVNSVIKENKIDSALIVFDDKNTKNLQKSARNLANVKALPYSALNVYDLINFKYLLLEKNLLQNIKEVVL